MSRAFSQTIVRIDIRSRVHRRAYVWNVTSTIAIGPRGTPDFCPLLVIRVDSAFRSLVGYPQRGTLPRPTETRLLIGFPHSICKQRAQPPQLPHRDFGRSDEHDARAGAKKSAYRLQWVCTKTAA